MLSNCSLRVCESLLCEKMPSRSLSDKSLSTATSIFFLLGAAVVLPWNAYITAVDYFTELFPDYVHIDRIFSVVYMCVPPMPAAARICLYSHGTASNVTMHKGCLITAACRSSSCWRCVRLVVGVERRLNSNPNSHIQSPNDVRAVESVLPTGRSHV